MVHDDGPSKGAPSQGNTPSKDAPSKSGPSQGDISSKDAPSKGGPSQGDIPSQDIPDIPDLPAPGPDGYGLEAIEKAISILESFVN